MTTTTETPQENQEPTIEAPEATTAPEPQDWNAEQGADAAEPAETTDGKKAKKLISLRVTEDDIAQAKALAEDLKVGYQTLLCELIHDGLAQREAQVRLHKLTESLKLSFPAVSAEELANSPAVKAAHELLNSPAVKSAQELVSSPVVKAAQELSNSPQFKAAQDFANTTTANFNALPAVQAARDLATTQHARMMQDFTASPAFKAAESMMASLTVKAAEGAETSEGATAEPASPLEFKQLSQAVNDIQAALKKAGLLK